MLNLYDNKPADFHRIDARKPDVYFQTCSPMMSSSDQVAPGHLLLCSWARRTVQLDSAVTIGEVNSVTRKDAYPLPRMDDMLLTQTGSKWFSGYWQVEIEKKDREKTAFCTSDGLFEYNVMSFGLCNAPATFQRLMDMVLAWLKLTNCLVYIDNIIVIGKTFSENLTNLTQVFNHLREAGLKLQPKK